MYSCFSASGSSRHIKPMIFPISQSLWSGLTVLTLSQTRREYRMYGISGFSGAFGGFGVFESICFDHNHRIQDFSTSCDRTKPLGIIISSIRLLTRFDVLPAFCGVNAGFPWLVCVNGFESLLRSDCPDPPDARSLSKIVHFRSGGGERKVC